MEHTTESTAVEKIIREQFEFLSQSIKYASSIQKAIMPSQEKMGTLLPSHFLLFKPRDIVSGDFYWAAQKENKTVVAVADCTGHGVPGALLTAIGICLLNQIVLESEITTASQILDQLQSKFHFTLSQKEEECHLREGMDIALCIIDFDKMELQFAGACYPLFLVRHGVMTEYIGDKMMINVQSPFEQQFTNQVVPLESGDTLYLFSDGFIDQFGGEKGEKKFGIKQFRTLLAEISANPLQQQKEMLEEIFELWRDEQYQIDDITILGIKI